MSRFFVLQTPVTSAPYHFAICTANVPTPPDAPMIRTFCPGRISPASRRPCRAVTPARGTPAACWKVRLAGLNARSFSGADTYSAKPPDPTKPKTSSPGRNRVTELPTASTSPATSVPRTDCFGLRSPVAIRRAM